MSLTICHAQYDIIVKNKHQRQDEKAAALRTREREVATEAMDAVIQNQVASSVMACAVMEQLFASDEQTSAIETKMQYALVHRPLPFAHQRYRHCVLPRGDVRRGVVAESSSSKQRCCGRGS